MHTETVTLHLQYFFPDHTPRSDDPHYHLFNEARARMKRLGLLKCWICGTEENIEVHHSIVEFALQNGVDIEKFKHLYPEFHITNDEDFAAFVEGPENLTALCHAHHTGAMGIHCLPAPAWNALRFWKDTLPVPGMKAGTA